MSAFGEFIIYNRLGRLESQLVTIKTQLKRMERKMSIEFETLKTEVTEMGTVVDSAVTLLEGLAAQLKDIKNDPKAIMALAVELDNKARVLADAIVANTPVEEPVDSSSDSASESASEPPVEEPPVPGFRG